MPFDMENEDCIPRRKPTPDETVGKFTLVEDLADVSVYNNPYNR